MFRTGSWLTSPNLTLHYRYFIHHSHLKWPDPVQTTEMVDRFRQVSNRMLGKFAESDDRNSRAEVCFQTEGEDHRSRNSIYHLLTQTKIVTSWINQSCSPWNINADWNAWWILKPPPHQASHCSGTNRTNNECSVEHHASAASSPACLFCRMNISVVVVVIVVVIVVIDVVVDVVVVGCYCYYYNNSFVVVFVRFWWM